MKLTRVNDLVTYVEPGSMAGFSACSGMIVRSRKTLLVDMNLDRDQIQGFLEKENPHACFITHYHLDHSVWLRTASNLPQANIFVPEAEARFLGSLSTVMEETARPLGRDRGAKWENFVVNTLGFAPLEGHLTFDSFFSFKELAPEMVVLHTPGHSPGHTSFYFPDHGILFSGDLGLDRFGPWYGWPNCDILELAASILRLDGMDIRLILTSHGGMITTHPHGALKKSILMILERENKIRDLLETGVSKKTIIEKGVFFSNKDKVAQPMKTFLDMWDQVMFQHHESLLLQGGLLSFFPEISNP